MSRSTNEWELSTRKGKIVDQILLLEHFINIYVYMHAFVFMHIYV